jgi:hypothetical protein
MHADYCAGGMRKLSDGRFYFVAAASSEESAAAAGRTAAPADGGAGNGGGAGIWQFALQGYMPPPAGH